MASINDVDALALSYLLPKLQRCTRQVDGLQGIAMAFSRSEWVY